MFLLRLLPARPAWLVLPCLVQFAQFAVCPVWLLLLRLVRLLFLVSGLVSSAPSSPVSFGSALPVCHPPGLVSAASPYPVNPGCTSPVRCLPSFVSVVLVSRPVCLAVPVLLCTVFGLGLVCCCCCVWFVLVASWWRTYFCRISLWTATFS